MASANARQYVGAGRALAEPVLKSGVHLGITRPIVAHRAVPPYALDHQGDAHFEAAREPAAVGSGKSEFESWLRGVRLNVLDCTDDVHLERCYE